MGDSQWHVEYDEEKSGYSDDLEEWSDDVLQSTDPVEQTENTPEFQDFKDDLNSRGAEKSSKQEDEGEAQKKDGWITRHTKKQTKTKAKEETRKSLVGVISGSIQKLFGRSAQNNPKDENDVESNAISDCNHRVNESNDDYGEDVVDDDDDDDDDEAMWSDSEFDEDFDNSEIYSNVNEILPVVDSNQGHGNEATTSVGAFPSTTKTTTTKPATTKPITKPKTTKPIATNPVTTTKTTTTKTTTTTAITEPVTSKTVNPAGTDLILFESDEEGKDNPEATVANDWKSNKNSPVKMIAQGFTKCAENGTTSLSHHGKSSPNVGYLDKANITLVKPDDQVSPSDLYQTVCKFRSRDCTKSKIPPKDPSNEVTLDVKSEIRKNDYSEIWKNKPLKSIPHPESKESPKFCQDQKSSSKPSLPSLQSNNWSKTPFCANPLPSKVCRFENPPNKVNAENVSIPSCSNAVASKSPGVEGVKIPAVHKLVKLFETEVQSRSPNLNQSRKLIKNTQDENSTQSIRSFEAHLKRPALQKKPNIHFISDFNSNRKAIAAQMDCSAPPVLQRRTAVALNSSQQKTRNPAPPPLPVRNRAALPSDGSSSPDGQCYLTPAAEADLVMASEDSIEREKSKRIPVKASTQALPPIPGDTRKPTSRSDSKGKNDRSDEPATVSDLVSPPIPTRGLATSSVTSGVKAPATVGANELEEVRENLRKASEGIKWTPPPKQRPSIPNKPPKSPVTDRSPSLTDCRPIYEDTAPDAQLHQHPWYFGDRSREDCEERLKAIGQNGTFIVRQSRHGGKRCPYTLSLFLNGATLSLSIRRRPDNTFALGTEKLDEIVYNDVMEIVNFHRINPINLHNGQSLKLVTSPPK